MQWMICLDFVPQAIGGKQWSSLWNQISIQQYLHYDNTTIYSDLNKANLMLWTNFCVSSVSILLEGSANTAGCLAGSLVNALAYQPVLFFALYVFPYVRLSTNTDLGYVQ